jgi:hypothetical protein
MPEQYLNGSEVARGLVDDRRLGSAQGMGTIFLQCQTNGGDPLVEQPCILTRAQVAISIDAARKREVIDGAASSPKPGQKASSCVRGDLKLNGSARLLLDHHRSGTDCRSSHECADLCRSASAPPRPYGGYRFYLEVLVTMASQS